MAASPANDPLQPEATERPTWAHFMAAVGLLTAVPLQRPDPHGPEFARASLFFPLVGGLMGTLLAVAYGGVAPRLSPWATAIAISAVWEFATTSGAAGPTPLVIANLATAVARFGLVRRLGPGATAALLFAPLLGGWGIVVLAVGARDAAAPARKFNPSLAFREFAWTSVASAVAVFALADAAGALAFVCAGALLLCLRLTWHRRPGGVSWPILRFSARLVELAVLTLFLER